MKPDLSELSELHCCTKIHCSVLVYPHTCLFLPVELPVVISLHLLQLWLSQVAVLILYRRPSLVPERSVLGSFSAEVMQYFFSVHQYLIPLYKPCNSSYFHFNH